MLTEHPNPEVRRLALRCDTVLGLSQANLFEEYGYGHLPLCVLDSVFSINARYGAVKNVVRRYCEYTRISPYPPGPKPSERTRQHTVSQLVTEMQRLGVEPFANAIFENRQRTSPRNGILKAEAVLRWACVLQLHQIECLQDIPEGLRDGKVEAAVKRIPGHSSGVSWRYFLMLTGTEDEVKPDRMLLAFLEETLGRTVRIEEALPLIRAACGELQRKYPGLNPRLLDNQIWKYQRQVS